MLHRFSRRSFLISLASVSAAPQGAFALDNSLRPVLRGPQHFKRAVPGADRIIAEAQLSGKTCFAVADVKSGRKLEGTNDGVGVPPASVTKAITALYAIETLGAEHRFATRVLADGPIQNGILQGDLILEGGGDPTLSTDGLSALVATMKAAGLREVRGGFKVVDGPLPRIKTIDPGQPDHVGYSPAVSGIALNFNRVHFEWRRSGGSYKVSMDARSERVRPSVYMSRMQVAARERPVYAYRDGGARDEWSVARGALGGSGSRWLPVRKPALYAGDVFQTLARSQGIALKTPKVVRSASGKRVLAVHQSPPLRIVLRDMLRFSTNLTAEMVGLAASIKRGARPGSLAASARQMNDWAEKRFGTRGIKLVDHSGLGDKSQMTASAMVAALLRAHNSGNLRPILKTIPMRDAKGRPIKNHAIKVEAKTGTLNFVSGLAGYMTGRNGQTLAFAIFAADVATRRGIAKSDREAPRGARSWNKRAKVMQQKLIERWGTLYAS